MAKRKVCKVCKRIVEDSVEVCPNCESRSQWNQSFQGRAYVFDAKNSFIGKSLHVKVKGEFAVKSRS